MADLSHSAINQAFGFIAVGMEKCLYPPKPSCGGGQKPWQRFRGALTLDNPLGAGACFKERACQASILPIFYASPYCRPAIEFLEVIARIRSR